VSQIPIGKEYVDGVDLREQRCVHGCTRQSGWQRGEPREAPPHLSELLHRKRCPLREVVFLEQNQLSEKAEKIRNVS
jgi:hypothetical protein